jgi:hypothetical protein
MAKNGSFLGSGHQVKLSPHETRLGLDEVFRQAEEELRCQERSDSFGRGWGGRGPTSNSEARRDFEISGISEVKVLQAKPPLPPSVPATPPAPEPNLNRPPFDSRYDSRQPRPQGGKGQGGRARTPSPNPGPGRGRPDQPGSPRSGSGGKGPNFGKGAVWTNPPAAKGGKGPNFGKGGAGFQRPSSQLRGRPSPSRERPCFCCGAPDHWARECPNKWCQNCLEEGHTSQECPKAPLTDRGHGPPRARDNTPPRPVNS